MPARGLRFPDDTKITTSSSRANSSRVAAGSDLAVCKRNYEYSAAESLIERRQRLAHLRRHEPSIVELTALVDDFRGAKTCTALQCSGSELGAKIAKDGDPSDAGAMTPIVSRAEIGRHADRPGGDIREEWVIIQAAVDRADQWRVVGERVGSRCIFQRQIERFG